jgi:hypothetical protein
LHIFIGMSAHIYMSIKNILCNIKKIQHEIIISMPDENPVS